MTPQYEHFLGGARHLLRGHRSRLLLVYLLLSTVGRLSSSSGIWSRRPLRRLSRLIVPAWDLFQCRGSWVRYQFSFSIHVQWQELRRSYAKFTDFRFGDVASPRSRSLVDGLLILGGVGCFFIAGYGSSAPG